MAGACVGNISLACPAELLHIPVPGHSKASLPLCLPPAGFFPQHPDNAFKVGVFERCPGAVLRPGGGFDPAPLSWALGQGLDCFSPAGGRKWALCPGSFRQLPGHVQGRAKGCRHKEGLFIGESCWFLLEKKKEKCSRPRRKGGRSRSGSCVCSTCPSPMEQGCGCPSGVTICFPAHALGTLQLRAEPPAHPFHSAGPVGPAGFPGPRD